ncbi:hypothetical protein [uncultured Kordia sp.]|uniref:hypothetical protein n=1 Tax=uncultured Kordia sp. TaxID=507699 RepID=UPI00261F52FB|nr:hypothetical protein [uncultured Kordia sp.]
MQKKLTQKDINKLRKKLSFVALFSIVVIAIFSAIYFFALKDFSSKSDGFDYIPLVIFGVFGLIFAGIIGYLAWSIVQDIKTGVKNCFEGIVEDKKLNIRHNSSSHAGARGSKSRSSSTKRDYFIVVDGKEHKVEYEMYNYVSVGDLIYFEVTPKSEVILHYEILEEVVTESKHAKRYSRNNYPNSKIRKAPLTREDKDSLEGFYKQKTRYRFKIIAFIALPIIGLFLNGLGTLLVFLFPLPLLLIYQLYKLLTFHLKYKKAVAEGRKKLVTTQVTDKLLTTISKNNHAKRSKRTLKTTYGLVKVPEMVYTKVNSGDEIIIHEALHLSSIIGISVDETYYAF